MKVLEAKLLLVVSGYDLWFLRLLLWAVKFKQRVCVNWQRPVNQPKTPRSELVVLPRSWSIRGNTNLWRTVFYGEQRELATTFR